MLSLIAFIGEHASGPCPIALVLNVFILVLEDLVLRELWPSGTVLACGAGDPGSNPLRTKT